VRVRTQARAAVAHARTPAVPDLCVLRRVTRLVPWEMGTVRICVRARHHGALPTAVPRMETTHR